MHLVSFEELQKHILTLKLDLSYLEMFTLYYLAEKEDGKIRLGEFLGVIRSQVYQKL